MWCSGGTMGFLGLDDDDHLLGWGNRSDRVGDSLDRCEPGRTDGKRLDILERRFAASEITRDEYEERRRLLESRK